MQLVRLFSDLISYDDGGSDVLKMLPCSEACWHTSPEYRENGVRPNLLEPKIAVDIQDGSTIILDLRVVKARGVPAAYPLQLIATFAVLGEKHPNVLALTDERTHEMFRGNKALMRKSYDFEDSLMKRVFLNRPLQNGAADKPESDAA